MEPGSPWKNGCGESFNRKLRDELLDGKVFYSLAKAKVVIESWRQQDNTSRPHLAPRYRPPAPKVELGPARPTTWTMAPKSIMHEHPTRTTP